VNRPAVRVSTLVELAGLGCLVRWAYVMSPRWSWFAGFGALMFVGYGMDDAALTRAVIDPVRRRAAALLERRRARRTARRGSKGGG